MTSTLTTVWGNNNLLSDIILKPDIWHGIEDKRNRLHELWKKFPYQRIGDNDHSLDEFREILSWISWIPPTQKVLILNQMRYRFAQVRSWASERINFSILNLLDSSDLSINDKVIWLSQIYWYSHVSFVLLHEKISEKLCELIPIVTDVTVLDELLKAGYFQWKVHNAAQNRINELDPNRKIGI